MVYRAQTKAGILKGRRKGFELRIDTRGRRSCTRQVLIDYYAWRSARSADPQSCTDGRTSEEDFLGLTNEGRDDTVTPPPWRVQSKMQGS
jgi:hypothetical protein